MESEDAVRERLNAARQQRLLNQRLSGKSLGEQLAGEELDSSAAWVQKSRAIEADGDHRCELDRLQRRRERILLWERREDGRFVRAGIDEPVAQARGCEITKLKGSAARRRAAAKSTDEIDNGCAWNCARLRLR